MLYLGLDEEHLDMALIVSLFTALLSIILAIFNWRMNKNAIILALFFFIFSTYGISHYLTIYGNSTFWTAVFYGHFAPLWLSAGPLLYFYVRGTLTDQQGLWRKDLWHFVPAFIHFINLAPYLFLSFTDKMKIAQILMNDVDKLKEVQVSWIYSTGVGFIERSVLIILYTLYVLRMLIEHNPAKQNFNKMPYRQYLLTYRWLLILTIIVLLVTCNFFLLVLSVLEDKASVALIDSKPVYLFAGIAFLLLPLSLLLFPQILYGMPIYSAKDKTSDTPEPISMSTANKETPLVNKTTGEPEDPFLELAQNIMDYLTIHKPYLKTDFSLTDLSIALKVPQHHVSYCFNTIIKMKFTQLRTQLRVAYAKELLEKGSAIELSMDGIGKESGFASRSNFYSAFKAETGLTPNEFLKHK